MANGTSDLEQRIEERVRLGELERRQQEEEITERVAERVGGGGPVFYGGGGPGIASVIAGVGLLAAVGGGAYYAYTKGYLGQFLGPVITGPRSVSQGDTGTFKIVGLTPGGSFTQQVIFANGTKSSPSTHTAAADGSFQITLSVDANAVPGAAQLQVTDQSTEKMGKKNFTILGATTSGGGGPAPGGGGPTGGLTVTGNPTAIQGLPYTVHISGATPNNQVKVELVTSSGADLVLLPYPNTGSKGAVDYEFTIGTNVALGALKVVVTDISNGTTASLNVKVYSSLY